MKTIIEPFRIKSVEPIRMTTRAEREEKLRAAKFNLFALKSEDVIIDLLTDSGTGAMSAQQWSAVMQGDESYAGSPSFERFKRAVTNLMPFKHIIPTHQGRAAEAILMSIFGGAGRTIPSNTHFDTTRGNIEASGAEAHDLNIAEGRDSQSLHPFKGNMDLQALDAFLAEHGDAVPVVMITITNNAGGGQPVSLKNIRATAALAHKYHKPFIIDGCRFAENAWFIKQREDGQQNRSIQDIVRDCFSVADGMTMSAKKDAFGNIGGWLALNDDDLAEQARVKLIQTEGFPTYGGLAGRDLDALAQGLAEIVDESYLQYRIRTNAYIVERLDAMGIPVVKPAGGHAVFIDAKRWLPAMDPLHFPAHAVACKLYEIGGIRACEIGSVMFGRQPDGSEKPAAMELVRLAFPRRTYTQSHADYIVEAFEQLQVEVDTLRGFAITQEPKQMRHFTCQFAPLDASGDRAAA
ncbi:tryptophanase [Ahrensia marina]|uniref:tryptophanase n=1 Tax=Ahrensia marina TaxID=1514904 RepID=UPI0035CF44C1